MEVLQTHGPKVLSFHLETVGLRWHTIRCYLAPHKSYTLEHVVAAISQRPWSAELFKVYMAAPKGHDQDETITVKIAT